MIPYARQEITPEDVAAVAEVLCSDWLTQGPAVERFERAVATYCEVPHAVALNSATAALHLACRALDLGPGDLLWTSPISFVASANCARYCGADVDFVDVDPGTSNMSVEALEMKLEHAAQSGRLPKVIVPVHFGGESCDMAAIAELARPHGCAIVEDASHAIGARYRGAPVGGCAHSDMAVFSFHPVKIITTGEGGMLMTRRRGLYERVLLLRSHGITRDPARMTGGSEGAWYYQQLELGYNYRMTDIQAALGASQLQRIDAFVARREELARRYQAQLCHLPVHLPRTHPEGLSAWHLYVIRLQRGSARTRREMFDALRAGGINVNVHYIPVHLQPYYRALGFGPGQFPEAERHYAEAVSLPMYPALSNAQQDMVVAQVEAALQ